MWGGDLLWGEGLGEDFDEAREGVAVEVGLWNPNEFGRKCGFGGGFEQIEVGIQHTVGEHVLHLLAKQGERAVEWRNGGVLYQKRLPQTLPNVASRAAANGYFSVHANVDVLQMPRFDGEFFQFHWQCVHRMGVERLAGIGNGATIARRTFGRALRGTEVHDGLVVGSGLRFGQQFLRQCGKFFFPLGGIDGRADAEVTAQHSARPSIPPRGKKNSFEHLDAVERGGETAQFLDLLGCGVQVSGTAVVAQPLPQA